MSKAEWLLADACEVASLEEAGLHECQVVIAATGDDKVNLVVSLLAKTEYGVPRTVARVNNPKNEWMFDEAWGVDVAVSMPRLMTALVEEAVSVGDLVRIFTFQQSNTDLRRADPAGGLTDVGRPGRRRGLAHSTRRWSRSSARAGRSCPPPTTRWSPATSCCSSPPATWAPSSSSCWHRTSTRPGSSHRGYASRAAAIGFELCRFELFRFDLELVPPRPRAWPPAPAWRPAPAGRVATGEQEGHQRRGRRPAAASRARASWRPSPRPCCDPRRGRGRAGRFTATRIAHGATSSQVSRLHSRTMAGSRRQAVMSPVTEPSIRPTKGQRTRIESVITAA